MKLKTCFLGLLIALALALSGCTTDPATARRILTDEGVSNITLTGYDWFSCGKDDTFSTGFTGTKNGRPVSGVICGGLTKANTVRYK